MTKILFLSQYLNVAGTESFMMNVFRHCDKSQYHFDFLLFTQLESDYTREVEAAGSKVYRLPNRKIGVLRYTAALERFFRKHGEEYDAIHWCGGNLSSIMPLRIAALCNIPIRIVHSHNSDSKGLPNKILHRLHKMPINSLITHRLACSEKAAKYFFNDQSATIIRNGIDANAYRYNPQIRKDIRKELNIEDHELVLGHVGRFDIVKNHKKLIAVFAEVVHKQPEARLLLIGEGATRKEAEQQTAELGLTDKVIFVGLTNQVSRYLQAMDVFVMPSLFEGLPFVLVEAQAAGLGCVLSDTIQQDSKITDNVAFISLQQADENWAEQILQVASKPRQDTYNIICKAGYDISTTIQQLTKIYSKGNK